MGEEGESRGEIPVSIRCHHTYDALESRSFVEYNSDMRMYMRGRVLWTKFLSAK